MSEIRIASFGATNFESILKEESRITNFKNKHARFVQAMKDNDFDQFLRGATLERLVRGMDGWITKNFDHVVGGSGQIIAAYELNEKAFIDFQATLMRNKLTKIGKTVKLMSDDESATLNAALEVYKTKCLPYVVEQCRAKLALALPTEKARKTAIEAQKVVVSQVEADYAAEQASKS